ncbi:MAG: hypothetical protein QM650_10585 [Microlunatus sp.]
MTSRADDEPSRRDSEAAIHRELLAARRRPGGLSPQSMALCPVMADLLGNGDPEVAHVELMHKVLEIIEADDDVMAIEAACHSLALATDANTHLARLEEFGAKHYLDQRQARRYSDRGLAQLARLIATHWTTQTVPEATVIVVGVPPSSVGLSIQLRCQRHVDMRPPVTSLWPVDQDAPSPLEPAWTRTSTTDSPWIEEEFASPEVLEILQETTIRLHWRGETWPKFTVVLTGDIDAGMVTVETLGAACAVTVRPGNGGEQDDPP